MKRLLESNAEDKLGHGAWTWWETPASPVSLYNPAIATMEADPTKAYDQGDATDFIRLNALRLKVATKVERKVK